MAPSMIRAVAGISKDHDGPWPQSIRLSGEIDSTSRSLGCSFIDTAGCVSVSEVDGMQLGQHAHRQLGELVARWLRGWSS